MKKLLMLSLVVFTFGITAKTFAMEAKAPVSVHDRIAQFEGRDRSKSDASLSAQSQGDVSEADVSDGEEREAVSPEILAAAVNTAIENPLPKEEAAVVQHGIIYKSLRVLGAPFTWVWHHKLATGAVAVLAAGICAYYMGYHPQVDVAELWIQAWEIAKSYFSKSNGTTPEL